MRTTVKATRVAILVCVILILAMLPFLINYLSHRETYHLLDAIEHDDVSAVYKILDDGADPNRTNIPPSKIWNFFEFSARMPLSEACRNGNVEIVEVLIEHGATAEYVEGTGWSALYEALVYYHPDDVQIVQLLLENGADLSFEQDGDAPVFWAAKMVPAVYDKNKTNGTVFATGYDEETAKGITEIVALLLNDASVDTKTSGGQTLLMYAAKVGNIYLVDYLLSLDCDRNCIDLSGKTALDYAVENAHSEIAERLMCKTYVRSEL